MIVQNTNPVSVCPDQTQVKRGFAREDLFVCVHEQFMTETAQVADVVLPATTFLEHDDIYRGGGHQYLILGPKLVEPPGECRSNHEVICGLAQRLGAEHRGFTMSPRELIDQMLQVSKRGTLAEIEANKWIDCQPPFRESHFLDGFPWPDGQFRFKPDWPNVPFRSPYKSGQLRHAEAARLRTRSKSRTSSIRPGSRRRRHAASSTRPNETPTSLAQESWPTVMIHRRRCGAWVARATTLFSATSGEKCACMRVFDGVRKGSGANRSTERGLCDGCGINTLVGRDLIAPYGGLRCDNRVWIAKRARPVPRAPVHRFLRFFADHPVDRVGRRPGQWQT